MKKEHDIKNAQNDVSFFIPKTVTSTGETIDHSFRTANSIRMAPQDFFNDRAIEAGEYIVSTEPDGSVFVSLPSKNLVDHYPFNAESTATAIAYDNQLLIAFSSREDGALTTYSPYIGQTKSSEIFCASGQNLGRVYSNGERLFYVDRDKRTVNSVLPYSSNIINESGVRISAYFVNINTIYYSVGEMLYIKKSGQDAKWLYTCEGYILDILATESCVYFCWENEQKEIYAARLDIYTNAYTPLSGNPE